MFNGQPLYILKMLGFKNLKKFESSESCLTAACKASSIYESYLTHFEPKPKNKTKNQTRKKFLTFREMELSCSSIKKFLYFLKGKLLLYFRKWSPALSIPNPKN